MPETKSKTDKQKQNPIQLLTAPPAVLMRFRKLLILLTHIFAFAASLMLSFLVIHNMQFKRAWFIDIYPTLLLFMLIVKIPVFGLFKQYRGWWRYVGISDLIGIVHASLTSTLIIVVLWFVAGNIEFFQTHLPAGMVEPAEGVCIADLFATVLILAGFRMVIRLYYEASRTVEVGRLRRFLIIGAGNAGEALLREIHRMPVVQYQVIGLIDDDPAKQGTHIHGTPVLGTVKQLPEICKDRNIDEIAIAMPSASHKQLRRVIQVCQGTKIRFRIVPHITDIASGKFRVSQIRDVDINDLLGRETVQLELDSIEAYIKDKTIMVTGAGGSIGSEMCRQLCNFRPKLVLLVEQAENPLFYIQRELQRRFPQVFTESLICNITDKNSLEQIFHKYKPHVVIHAAAHKHVPLMELNAAQAIRNNILGTKIVADAADKFGSTNFVLISTDKAVNPTSIMGSSKRIAEIYVQDLSSTSRTHFVTVRFGNVLDSEGSVVPIFKKQIAEGGPVTVTDPEMKRYFMTIPEASQLVLQAAAMGKGGEIFVLDMGEPVKIIDLARELITLSGFRPGEDIEIEITGPRPGEKLFEELSIEGEDMQRTRHPKISIWKNIPMERDKLRTGINEIIKIAETQNRREIIKKIKELIPEYSGSNSIQEHISSSRQTS
jgi:FlaA1/EpsC-like NDP-sugar epimerase